MGFAERDGLEIIFHQTENKDRITPNYPYHQEDALDIFAMVYGVEELYNELAQKGAKLHKQLKVNDYGMKEFSIIDPDGYTIGFGESIQD
ncbi:Glyoxalase-like domain protein [compost metagenome]